MGIGLFSWPAEFDPWPDDEERAETSELPYQADRSRVAPFSEPRFEDIIASDEDLPNPFGED